MRRCGEAPSTDWGVLVQGRFRLAFCGRQTAIGAETGPEPHPIERSSPVKRMRKCCWPSYPFAFRVAINAHFASQSAWLPCTPSAPATGLGSPAAHDVLKVVVAGHQVLLRSHLRRVLKPLIAGLDCGPGRNASNGLLANPPQRTGARRTYVKRPIRVETVALGKSSPPQAHRRERSHSGRPRET